LNIPNILTLVRLLLIPLFIICFFSHNPGSLQISVAIFFAAGLTDVLDGYIARKYNLITKFGTAIDPLADKLMLLSVLFCLAFKLYIPLWVFLIIALKELSMIVFGIFLYNKNVVIPANIFGKIASLLFYIAILFDIYKPFVGKILIYIAVLSAVIAFVNYINVYITKKA
jgi:cardiolipin synthase